MAIRNPCTYLPRRLQVVASLTITLLLILIGYGIVSNHDIPYQNKISESARHVGSSLSDIAPPTWINPFHAAGHTPPPEQSNSTTAETSWHSDWKWLQNPFSSSITFDENRLVLPPEQRRVPVYTYYDNGAKKHDKVRRAEHELLLIWRRAWWAKGFKPVVLGKPEALANPLYRSMQNLQLEATLEADLMRWLAWGTMGSGILANWLALPMAEHNDDMLVHLRHGEYPALTRYEELGNGFIVGEKRAITAATKIALSAKQPIKADSVFELVPRENFAVSSGNDAVAFYSLDVIDRQFKGLTDKLRSTDTAVSVDGLRDLTQLIISHLHMTWQNTFTKGIAILKPMPEHTSHAVFTAIELGRNLSQCTNSPFPSSCPPNIPRCRPCFSSQPLLLSAPAVFRNVSTQFTIGTIPHPYTLNALVHQMDTVSVRSIRRDTKRDQWIMAVTKEVMGTGSNAYARLVDMKSAIASDYGQSHSIWITAERHDDAAWREDLAWIFGFPVPQTIIDDGKSETPVPGPERRPPPPKPEGTLRMPDEKELKHEEQILDAARETIKSRSTPDRRTVRDAVEAWNLADTELWRFVRAFSARRRMERLRWEEQEAGFAGSEGRGKGTWGRWFDTRTDDDSRM